MNLLKRFHRHTSIRTKGVIYVVVLIMVIFLTVSALVMTTVKRNLIAQLNQFHWSIAEKLAQTAADSLLSRDYSFLMGQIRQLKSSGDVARVTIVDTRRIIVASDRIADIGSKDAGLTELPPHQGRQLGAPAQGGTEILMPIEIGREPLGALRVCFDWSAEGKRIDRELAQTLRRILYLASIIFALGIGGAFVVSRALTRPIIELSREIEQFDKEIYPQDISRDLSPHEDESLQLRDAFTRMMANLRTYLEKNKKISAEREKLSCMAAIGQMSAQIAHETRNSLYAIRGAIAGLETSDNPSERRDYLEVIKDEAREMTRMSDDFLQFARTPEPEIIPCRVEEVVQRVTELLAPDLEDAGITVQRQGREVPRVMADPTLLKRAFMNLFLNAIQAMPEGGAITVGYRVVDDSVETSVQDDGPGIPEEINVKVFQPFFSTKIDGTGLGLPTVYRLVVAQHGEIDLENSEIGARFTIQLPIAKTGEA